VYYAQSQYDQAASSYNQAHEISSRMGDENGQANALWGLGRVYSAQFKYDQATSFSKQAEEIYARLRNNLGYEEVSQALVPPLGSITHV
ncbi:hypothetical protein FS837_003164, partial [Tulasnella sp. UAMH 9824]